MNFYIFSIISIASVLFITDSEGTKPLPGPAVIATKGEVWPKPWQQTKPGGYFLFTPDSFEFQLSKAGNNCSLLQIALDRYKKIIQDEQDPRVDYALEKKLNDDDSLGNLENIAVFLTQPCNGNKYPSLESNETYTLTITSFKTVLEASSIWGLIRGLETFSQLIYLERANDSYSFRIEATIIDDHPRFQHRGLLLDTSRHYTPLKQIYEILDGLTTNKMNVFHWHITDDQSFPYVSEKYPELSKIGAYTQRQIYKVEGIKNVIEYARVRGIRVMPEFDTPGHTRSWGLSHPELICHYESIYGPMDPSKNTTYTFLNEIFTEIRQLFKDEYIHLGGDEVDFNCWVTNPDIVAFMNEQGLHQTSEYINYYGQKVINMVDGLNFNTIVWEEMFFNGVQLSNESVVQIWRDWEGQLWTTNIASVTAAGKKALLASCWYLDVLSQTWENFYSCEPLNFGGTDAQMELVIGGEACMWGEMVNENNVVSRIFPRASATAEKLWSNGETFSDADRRLEEHVCRMNRRGISAEPPNGPGYCD